MAVTTGAHRPRVLVTDAETRAVVAACRGLRAGGFDVAAVAGARPAPGHWSRACRERFHLPHPLEDEEGFVAGLEEILSGRRYSVLLAGSDPSLVVVSRHRARLEGLAAMALPPHETVMRSIDKLALAEAAASSGLDPPESVVCHGVPEAIAAARRLGFPIVLKTVRAVPYPDSPGRRAATVRADDSTAVAELAPAFGDACLVQRVEPGSVLSYGGVFVDGRLLGVAPSRYLRTWYPQAGNACFSETVAPPEDLSRRVAALLAALEWEGMFELELIEGPDGSYSAVDLNPRVYGSLALGIRAGANLPAVWCRWALGEHPSPVVAKPGLRYRWEDADLRHLIWQLRRGRLAAAGRVMMPHRAVAHPHFELLDPGPFVARALFLAGLKGPSREAPAATTPDVRDVPQATRSRRAERRSGPGEVAILGAGPYGLAAAAYLREAGVPVRVFGEVLEFWRKNMPRGMMLRSRKRSTHIADPREELTIDHYAANGRSVTTPSLTLAEFVDYGLWFQRRAVPDVDPRKVRRVEPADWRFGLVLEDGEELVADRVVVAGGLGPFGRRPEPFASLPPSFCSHSSEHTDLGVFAGRSVLVVGGGQSALESAALLAEGGATVEVLARIPEIHWLGDGKPGGRKGIRSRLPLPPTDVGGFVTGWTAAAPDLWRRVPGRLKPEVSFRCIRPAGSGWLRPRLEAVPIPVHPTALAVDEVDGKLRVKLDDGGERVVDHVLLGTGYEIDVRRYPFLAPEFAASLEVADGGYPRLGPGLESSVPGLHFVGAPAAASFGPIMRFVVGTWYAAPALTLRVLDRRQPPLRFSFAGGLSAVRRPA